jgi:transcriptional regulator with XRE-family HTH domain
MRNTNKFGIFNIEPDMLCLAYKELGLSLQKWRNERHLTLDFVARITGISSPFLSEVENGHRMCDLAIYFQMSSAIAMPVHDAFSTSIFLLPLPLTKEAAAGNYD